MDPLEEFLSPEAMLDSDSLATPVDQPSVMTSDQSLSLTTPPATTVDIPPLEENKPTRKRVAFNANIPGCSTLVLDKASSAKPKRAKFDAEGRAKVASVRRKGACMKCRRNKTPCSGEWPCESCCRSRAIIAERASKHRWMDCVPFSLKDLDIYAHEIVRQDYLTDELVNRDFGLLIVDFSDIWLDDRGFAMMTNSGTLAFYVTFDMVQFSFGLSSTNLLISGSKVSIANRVDSKLDKTFRFLAITYLLRFISDNNSFTGNTAEDLRNAQSVAGSQLLQCLEKTLSSNSLSNFGADTLRALMRILLFTVSVVIWSGPRLQSSPEFHDRQKQLLRVLAHHMVYIGERLHYFENLDSEVFIRHLTSFARSSTLSHHGKTDNSVEERPITVANPVRGSTIYFPESLKEKSAAIHPVLDPRKGDIIGQPRPHNEANTVSEQKNDWTVVQQHGNAKSTYLPESASENRYWTFSHHNQINPAISTSTVTPLPELQPDTICGLCGCLQVSYKPSHGMVSCDRCFTPYQRTDLTASGWSLGEYQSTDQPFNPANGLDSSLGDMVDDVSGPEVTTWGSHGNDLDDFSWCLAS